VRVVLALAVLQLAALNTAGFFMVNTSTSASLASDSSTRRCGVLVAAGSWYATCALYCAVLRDALHLQWAGVALFAMLAGLVLYTGYGRAIELGQFDGSALAYGVPTLVQLLMIWPLAQMHKHFMWRYRKYVGARRQAAAALRAAMYVTAMLMLDFFWTIPPLLNLYSWDRDVVAGVQTEFKWSGHHWSHRIEIFGLSLALSIILHIGVLCVLGAIPVPMWLRATASSDGGGAPASSGAAGTKHTYYIELYRTTSDTQMGFCFSVLLVITVETVI